MKKKKKKNTQRKRKRHFYSEPIYSPIPNEPIFYSELDEQCRQEIRDYMAEMADEFIAANSYIPDEDDRQDIMREICLFMSDRIQDINEGHASLDLLFNDNELDDPEAEEESEEESQPAAEKELIPDQMMTALFDEILNEVLQGWRADGFDPPEYIDTLVVRETERLKIRRFICKDIHHLFDIMKKPEVMLAWERGLKKREVKRWLTRQMNSCQKTGYGCYAVTLKESNRLIGYAGLCDTDYAGETVVELEYLLDNAFWGRGYCHEAVTACAAMAFQDLGMERLYCFIRPENIPSVKAAEKLGMTKTGEYIKIFDNKEMLHVVYTLENNMAKTDAGRLDPVEN